MAMIIPPSTVNVMQNYEDCCFQCKEPGHITCSCPHIRCYECDEYGHIVMDCPHRIPPSGTLATHCKSHKGHHARSSSRHHHEDRDRQSQSSSESHFRRHHSLSHHDSHRGHSRSQHRDRHSHNRSSSWWSHSAHRGHSQRLALTHHIGHIADYPNIEALQVIHPNIHSQPSYRSSRYESHWTNSHSSRMRRRPHPKKNMKVKIEDPHTDYYSCNDHSSDSGEDSDPLN